MIKPGQTIGTYLDHVISEGLKQRLLVEKEGQIDEPEDDDIFTTADGEGQGGMKPDESTEQRSKPGEVDTSEIEPAKNDISAMKQVPELDDVIEKLNSLRSGRSLSDETVSQAFEQYYGRLDDPEKVALFTFMKGIAQIVTGEVPGNNAVDPSEHPANVDMKKNDTQKNVTIKPAVIKKPLPTPGKKTSNKEEDTTAPAPIKPKKRGLE